MNKLYTQCSTCGRVIYASQAAENGGVCGPDCPAGAPKAPRKAAAATAPAPRERIVEPPEPAPTPAAPPEGGGIDPVGVDREAPDTLPAPVPQDAPEPRQSGPGANRMHRAAERGGSR